MSELAAGFRAGTQMAQSGLDAYNSAKSAREEREYRDELEKINQGRNLKALGIEPSGGIGVKPVQLEGIQQVPGAAPTDPNYLASMPNAVALPDIGLGAPEQAQPFTGFTGGAAQLAESMDPNYGLAQKIALAEKYGMDKDYVKYSGQQDRVAELGRAETAERQRQYEAGLGRTRQQERDETTDKYNDDRLSLQQAQVDKAALVAEKQLTVANNQIRIDSQNEATRQAQQTGTSLYSQTIMSGGSLNDAYTAIGEQYPQRLEDGSVNQQYSAAMAVVNQQAIADSGLNAQSIGSINNSVISSIDNALNFEGDEPQRIERLNEAAAVIFDSDPYDNVTPRIARASDLPSGYAPIDGGYVILEGDRLVDSFDSLDEISKMGESFKEQLNNNPVNYAVLFAEQKQKRLTATLASAKDQATRQKAYFSFIEKNPNIVGSDRMREIEKMYGVGQPLNEGGRFGGGTPNNGKQPKGLFSATDTNLEQEATEAQLLAERRAVYTPEAFERISDPRTAISDLETIANDPAAPEEFKALVNDVLMSRRGPIISSGRTGSAGLSYPNYKPN